MEGKMIKNSFDRLYMYINIPMWICDWKKAILLIKKKSQLSLKNISIPFEMNYYLFHIVLTKKLGYCQQKASNMQVKKRSQELFKQQKRKFILIREIRNVIIITLLAKIWNLNITMKNDKDKEPYRTLHINRMIDYFTVFKIWYATKMCLINLFPTHFKVFVCIWRIISYCFDYVLKIKPIVI